MTTEEKNLLLKVKGEVLQSVERKPFVEDSVQEKSELLNIVFAPHPKYGFPCSDIEVLNSKSTNDVVRAALERQNRIIPDSEISSSNDDDVLDGMQLLNESDEDYALRQKGKYSEDND